MWKGFGLRMPDTTQGLWRIVGATLAEWMRTALAELMREAPTLDAMNVFPVADGDTGRNMVSTLQAAVEAVARLERRDLGAVWQEAAHGALMGARGNSGVILSQLLAGFAELAEGRAWWEASDLRQGFRRAAERARRYVPEPAEGTILTVADAMAEGASATGDIIDCLSTALEAGREALQRTTEQLPALHRTQLVDAGALGYVCIVQGWLDSARGRPGEPTAWAALEPAGRVPPLADAGQYYYDVEALLYQFRCRDPEAYLRRALPGLGDSIVLAPGREMLKVHVHTDAPVKLMEILTSVGDIQHMEWWDMRQQVAARRARSLRIVVPEPWGGVFQHDYEVLTPDEAEDADDTLWLAPPAPLSHALAVPSVGLMGQLALEYDESEPWAHNRARLAELLKSMRHWVVMRDGEHWWLGDGSSPVGNREEVLTRIQADLPEPGVVTVYLSHLARREEASYWQDALNAELVQIPEAHPWMEVVWQP